MLLVGEISWDFHATHVNASDGLCFKAFLIPDLLGIFTQTYSYRYFDKALFLTQFTIPLLACDTACTSD